jgi:hypothetical protein
VYANGAIGWLCVETIVTDWICQNFLRICQRVFTVISEFSLLFVLVPNLELLTVSINSVLLEKSTALYIRSTPHSLFTPHSS